ncbi:cytochrome P450 family protein [Amycolatopsis regifaucium]|uniref:Cytochrome n=1 Tax=Amycolatopsis regifaucium TaxID=546365 RepID=A0A154MRE7_9PSEU|nr:cytochrome P450 [Amycolatopsis regifaucium]KZB86513.1 cytochrome [Amycolatopsis regifaucium]OKA03457.1 cytochrome [Amycolatopsis regifaucium]SFJ13461.1 Cytochrome P450 [Amycolatopsis regifaucium]
MTENRPKYLATPRYTACPYAVFDGLRETAPAVPVQVNGFRMWAVTRYADVREILADPDACKDIVQHRKKVVPQSILRPEHSAKLAHRSRRSLLDRDGPDHRRLRTQLSGEFSPARVARLRPAIERTAASLLDRLPVGEPVDLVAEYSRPLVTTVLADLLGLPGDERGEFPAWQMSMLTGNSVAEAEDGARRLHELALRMIEVKKREPGDDLFTRLLRIHEADGGMDVDELASTYVVMLIGGSEPVTSIGSGLALLLDRPDTVQKLLAAPELFGKAVEEIVRYESPFKLLPPRFCEKPVDVGGVQIPAGEMIAVSPGAANRDPARFPDPDTFDIERDTRGHLGFGHGAHRCLGAGLGRLETEIALRMLLTRFPRTRLMTAPEDLVWRPGSFMRRLDGLPAILD